MEDKLIADLKESYGITCYQITPVTGGLLNLKWKVSTKKVSFWSSSTARSGFEEIKSSG